MNHFPIILGSLNKLDEFYLRIWQYDVLCSSSHSSKKRNLMDPFTSQNTASMTVLMPAAHWNFLYRGLRVVPLSLWLRFNVTKRRLANFLTKRSFFVNTTYYSVNLTRFIFPCHQSFDNRNLFKPKINLFLLGHFENIPFKYFCKVKIIFTIKISFWVNHSLHWWKTLKITVKKNYFAFFSYIPLIYWRTHVLEN